MKLSCEGLKNKKFWEEKSYAVPGYDIEKMKEFSRKNPRFVHFGGGNIFRMFIARLYDDLLATGNIDSGVIVADTFDYEMIEKVYSPFDDLTIAVTLNADGTVSKRIVAAIGETVNASETKTEADVKRLKKIFSAPTLQLATFTITEKGYALRDSSGKFLRSVEADLNNGPSSCGHAMSIVSMLLNERFLAGGKPIALVSTDNCSMNGDRLKAAIFEICKAWQAKNFVSKAFVEWIEDENNVAFPLTMIDKITPRPADAIQKMIEADGIEDVACIVTKKKTFASCFVNAEKPEYLVVEDKFPNGRPDFEKVGVYMTDRTTVQKSESMKVQSCLNPLHTALAVLGCLLGYTKISDEMKDDDLRALVLVIGRDEGIKVVVDPKIISPQKFLNEVLNERFPNPFLPDTPQRIATDTSQKVGIRFGETIKAYLASKTLDPATLDAIPLAIAGWLRYLLAVEDGGKPFECSPDPLLAELQGKLKDIHIGSTDISAIDEILSNKNIFGLDLNGTVIAKKVKKYFAAMVSETGAVRKTLHDWAIHAKK